MYIPSRLWCAPGVPVQEEAFAEYIASSRLVHRRQELTEYMEELYTLAHAVATAIVEVSTQGSLPSPAGRAREEPPGRGGVTGRAGLKGGRGEGEHMAFACTSTPVSSCSCGPLISCILCFVLCWFQVKPRFVLLCHRPGDFFQLTPDALRKQPFQEPPQHHTARRLLQTHEEGALGLEAEGVRKGSGAFRWTPTRSFSAWEGLQGRLRQRGDTGTGAHPARGAPPPPASALSEEGGKRRTSQWPQPWRLLQS